MTKKAKPAKPVVLEVKAPAPAKPEAPAKPDATLADRVAELERDLKAVAELLGRNMGEPYRTRLNEIVNR